MEIDKDVFIQQGILDCQIDQLINFSNTDPEVKKFTSDPIRFRDLDSFKKWLQQGKIIYTLTNKQQNLLGIIWFSQKNPPIKINANFTFAIRIYPPARGQGLSFIFLKTAFDDISKSKSVSNIKNVWLEVSEDNKPAIKTYKKIGFKVFSESTNKDKIIMVLNSSLAK